jgi:electron transfer flavoprotein alpha subunit
MVVVYAEHNNGVFGKSAFEAMTYARKSADELNTSVAAVVFGKIDGSEILGQYGADKIYLLEVDTSAIADSQAAAIALSEVCEDAQLVVLNHNSFGKSVAGRLSIRLKAGLVSGAVSAVSGSAGSMLVKKSVFSGKAYANYKITSSIGIVTVIPNSIPVGQSPRQATIESVNVTSMDAKVEVISTDTQTGVTPLPEAELVVSAGRGMKDASNWGIIEELAESLGATTACSRPVSDVGWRPHHEHVGQTGLAIRPNLYIAIGISGAIQHLAGVNNSKVIVVINKDEEAPFFKAADYGVCADLFDVVPRLTEAIKSFKSSN